MSYGKNASVYWWNFYHVAFLQINIFTYVVFTCGIFVKNISRTFIWNNY